jgi:hypothetical protein
MVLPKMSPDDVLVQTVYAVRRFLGSCGGIAVNDRGVCEVIFKNKNSKDEI